MSPERSVTYVSIRSQCLNSGVTLLPMPNIVKACAGADLGEQQRLVIDVGTVTVGFFRLDGKVFAYENTCPHQGGPVCQGTILPRVIEKLDESKTSAGFAFDPVDRHIVCPWHGFEFDIRTGIHAGSSGIRLKAIPVEETNGEIYVRLP